MDKSKRTFWQNPWNYKEGFTIAIALVIVGFLIEIISGKGFLKMPSWPVNAIVIVLFIAYLLISSIIIKHPIIKFLSSISASISAVTVFTILILIMGLVPQNDSKMPDFVAKIGLSHVKSSYAYLLSSTYLITILGYTIIRRVKSFSLKNLAFFFNHAGLWIILVTASLGSGDLYRFKMVVNEGNTSMEAIDGKNVYPMPFGIQLIDFSIAPYPPNILLYSKETKEPVYEKTKGLNEVIEGATYQMKNWKVKIDKYLPMAKMKTKDFNTDTTIGAVHAVYLTAINSEKDTVKGWISTGNIFFNNAYIELGEKYYIAMTTPSPKEYKSLVNIYKMPEGKVEQTTISVNKPVSVKGWTIYQTGFDEKMGRWSTQSVFDVVKDPWLPMVYIGIFMMLLGSLYLLWTGKK